MPIGSPRGKRSRTPAACAGHLYKFDCKPLLVRSLEDAVGQTDASIKTFDIEALVEKARFEWEEWFKESLFTAFDQSHQHPMNLSASDKTIPATAGIYAFYRVGDGWPSYVGKTGDTRGEGQRSIRERINQHRATLRRALAKGTPKARAVLEDRTFVCRFLEIPDRFLILHAEALLIRRFAPPWQDSGFSKHHPGRKGRAKEQKKHDTLEEVFAEIYDAVLAREAASSTAATDERRAHDPSSLDAAALRSTD